MPMVTIKNRTINGKTYVYASGSTSYSGHQKRFEKLIGPAIMDPSLREKRIQFHSGIINEKCRIYGVYLRAKYSKHAYLPGSSIFLLEFIRATYKDFLADLYPTELDKYRKDYEIRYVYNTTAIEGNTLTLRETALVLDDGLAPRNKKLREIHEIDNYRRLLKFVENYRKDITKIFMRSLNECIQRNIDDDNAGMFRRIDVGIAGSNWSPTPHIFIEDELDGLLKWYRDESSGLHPFERAGEFHHRFLQIHPFIDGNGRVARELLNFILTKNDYPPIIISVEHREDYLKCLEMADEGNITPLLIFLIRQMFMDYSEAIVKAINKFNENHFTGEEGELDDHERKEFGKYIVWVSELMKEMFGIPPNLNVDVPGIFRLFQLD